MTTRPTETIPLLLIRANIVIAIPKYATEPTALYTSHTLSSLLFSEDNAYVVRVLVHVCMCKHPILRYSQLGLEVRVL